ncbi:hypothetical protein [Jannaschia sp. R86511]|uniref:ApeA N-terminal domain 1-containing protein n=1 Tax=Jannaschia sp. R86511 TaxID=3093853 RepID=UPI0036D33C31
MNTPRLGWLYDRDASTPDVSVMLLDDGEAITLTVPWQSRDSPYLRWFHGHFVEFADDPGRDRYTYDVPETLWFRDVLGSVALIGCRMRSSMEPGPLGQGVITVGAAILGAQEELDYSQIHALRTDVPGLGQWMRLRSLTHEASTDHENRLQTLTLRLRAPDPIPIDEEVGLQIRPNFTYTIPGRPDTTQIQETLEIHTALPQLQDWWAHSRVHGAFVDLPSLACWRPLGYRAQWAQRNDDPERSIGGKIVGDKWSHVRSYRTRPNDDESQSLQFLFDFSSVGPAGAKEWLRMRQHFERGMNHILDTLRTPRALETSVSQLGIGLDGLGYRLLLDDGHEVGKASKASHATKLERVMEDLLVTPPFEPRDWTNRMRISYRAVKHAEHDMPEYIDLLNTVQDARLIFRLWVASRIGVPAEDLARGLSYDRMTQRFEAP